MAVRQGPRLDLPYDEREVVLRADFDDLDDGDCCWISMRFMGGPRHPAEGDRVYLLDRKGHGCMADVLQVVGWSARVQPDWSTWTGEDPAPTA